jgi:hypothetical protein
MLRHLFWRKDRIASIDYRTITEEKWHDIPTQCVSSAVEKA